MSKVTAYYHVVFCTKWREMTIPMQLRDDVYRFIWRQLTDMRCDLLRIGGIQNHVHMLIDLHPAVALSELMQRVKGVSSTWMRRDPRFVQFRGWASEYYASTVAPEQRHRVADYIRNQETHHLATPLDREIVDLCRYAGLEYDDRDMR